MLDDVVDVLDVDVLDVLDVLDDEPGTDSPSVELVLDDDEVGMLVDVVDVLVVGSDGGGGSDGMGMSPKSGKASWEQSMGTPVSPSTKLQ